MKPGKSSSENIIANFKGIMEGNPSSSAKTDMLEHASVIADSVENPKIPTEVQNKV